MLEELKYHNCSYLQVFGNRKLDVEIKSDYPGCGIAGSSDSGFIRADRACIVKANAGPMAICGSGGYTSSCNIDAFHRSFYTDTPGCASHRPLPRGSWSSQNN